MLSMGGVIYRCVHLEEVNRCLSIWRGVLDVVHMEAGDIDVVHVEEVYIDVVHVEEVYIDVVRVEEVYIDVVHVEEVYRVFPYLRRCNIDVVHMEEVYIDVVHVEEVYIDVVHMEEVYIDVVHMEEVYIDVVHVEEVYIDVVHVEEMCPYEEVYIECPMEDGRDREGGKEGVTWSAGREMGKEGGYQGEQEGGNGSIFMEERRLDPVEMVGETWEDCEQREGGKGAGGLGYTRGKAWRGWWGVCWDIEVVSMEDGIIDCWSIWREFCIIDVVHVEEVYIDVVHMEEVYIDVVHMEEVYIDVVHVEEVFNHDVSIWRRVCI
ncbi:unnamed protein product [Coregonus sp. 'balchen']|nr:unnamed protein product [Coregonus sp. 'balchen']